MKYYGLMLFKRPKTFKVIGKPKNHVSISLLSNFFCITMRSLFQNNIVY